MKATFLKVATTGLTQNDRIISYCACVWDSEKGLGPSFSRRIFPPIRVPKEVAAINGYREDVWIASGATPFGIRDAQTLWPMLDGAIIAGHNVDFDIGFLTREFANLAAPFPRSDPKQIDTKILAVPLFMVGKIGNTGLDDLATYYGLSGVSGDPASDVYTTIQVFEAMCLEYLT